MYLSIVYSSYLHLKTYFPPSRVDSIQKSDVDFYQYFPLAFTILQYLPVLYHPQIMWVKDFLSLDAAVTWPDQSDSEEEIGESSRRCRTTRLWCYRGQLRVHRGRLGVAWHWLCFLAPRSLTCYTRPFSRRSGKNRCQYQGTPCQKSYWISCKWWLHLTVGCSDVLFFPTGE